MDGNLLLGVAGGIGLACGGWGLVLSWDKKHKNGNGHAPEPVPVQQWPPELAALLTHITERLETAIERVEHPLVAAQTVAAPAPLMITGLAELPARIEQGLAPVFEGAIGRMASLVQLQIETLKPQQETLSAQEWDERFGQVIEAIREQAPAPVTPVVMHDPGLETMGAQIVRGIAEIPDKLARQIVGMFGGSGGGGTASPPPLRRDPPPNLASIPPGVQPVTPQVPASYVGGSVYATAGQVADLLVLIQYQLSPNCPGTSAEFSISAEDAPVFVGAASTLGGPLSATNYAYQLTPGGPPRIYRSTFPGNNTPIGELQVLSPGGGYLHVEVQS